MSKKIRYAGEVFSGYNKPKKTPGESKEVRCSGQGQERQRQDRPLWRPEDGPPQRGWQERQWSWRCQAPSKLQVTAQLRREERQDNPGLLVL